MRDNRFMEPEGGGGVMGWAVKLLALWVVAGVVLYIVVAGRGPLAPREAATKPAPAPAATEKPPAQSVSNSLILRAGRNGYVYVDASVNGTPMRMAFDTGASYVSLTQEDAEKAGISGGLNYSMEFSTANGHAYGAPVTLRQIRIGQLEIDDVRAVVMKDLGVSLLGQTFLSRLDTYQVHDGVMTLTW